MAWVSRSIRDFDLSKTNTSDALGPGSYISHEPFLKQPKYASAPFFSTEKRYTTSTNEKFLTPGPGTYSSPTAFTSKTDRSSVFKSATTRFDLNTSIEENPGPGSYQVKSDIDSFLEKKFSKSPPKTRNPSTPTKQLSTAPSIPANTQSHGYEEGPRGELIRQRPPDGGYKGTYQDSIGPGQYFVEEITAPRKTQGIFTSSTTRDIFKIPKNPGPGAYDSKVNDMSRSYGSIFGSRTQRSSLVPIDKIRSPNLGPGAYDSKEPKLAHKTKHQPFGSTTSRPFDFSSTFSSAPGPGEYIRVFEEKYVSSDRTKVHGPFNAKTERFNYKSKDAPPGPGSYNDSNYLTNDLTKKPRGAFGVFGSTSARFTNIEKAKAPPPGSYNVPEKLNQVRKTDARSSTFQSRTTRSSDNNERKLVKDTTPPVGVYAIANENWSKKSFSTRTTGFTSTTSRFTEKLPRDRAAIVGPNYLPPSFTDKKPKGIDLSKNTRVQTAPISRFESPHIGPGTYDHSPSWIKPSHNVTITQL
ncbi:predicted protein [Naegleria gruberi]|uniref:Predicted protein n=1 Tax=Naegleria gruberi TaxID=5762 RepID=D2VU16_NAEGR|nr:uncharacterized protein NAEGRDRAFT_52250 [Naegleria gruberi]EFC39817.1 predicted protein [Naegleria gruberi]|eukprot:XP_002672561.1 predicted protein [Naegleria gruberi strain NEG-M]